MKVTNDYLGLDEDVRKCQNIEPFENCTTRQYLDSVLEQCKCVPFALRDFSKSTMTTVRKIANQRNSLFDLDINMQF